MSKEFKKRKLREDREIEMVLETIMSQFQRDFHDNEFWKKKDFLVEPLVVGIWEFKEDARELGFQVGLS
jgi:hypothetical protein